MNARLLFLTTLFPICSLFGQNDIPRGPIDTVLVRSIDLTDDGIPEEVKLRLQAKDFYSTFSWSLVILSLGDTVYEYAQIDSSYDELFLNSEIRDYMECPDYETCKYEFYFKSILDFDIQTTGADIPENMLGTIYDLGKEVLRTQCGLNEKEAKDLIKHTMNSLRGGKGTTFYFSTDPRVGSSPTLTYVRSVRRFIPIYTE